jgi:type I restriction enzyme S subunit
MVLNSPLITGIAAAKTTGGAAPRINVATVKAYPIPVPPLKEQRTILTKVNELLSLCDQLETRLDEGHRERVRLLDSVLYHALSSSMSDYCLMLCAKEAAQ